MGEVINLRNFRKTKKRAEREREAARNRARTGRSKAERKREERDADDTVAFLDDRRLDKKDDEEAS